MICLKQITDSTELKGVATEAIGLEIVVYLPSSSLGQGPWNCDPGSYLIQCHLKRQ